MEFASTNAGYGYVIRLEKGERVIENLTMFAQNEDIFDGFFYGLGAVKNTTLSIFDTEIGDYNFLEFEDTMELASINGNISNNDGKPFIHAHVVLGDEKFNAFAGHLKEATVAVTCEIFLHLQHGAKMDRQLDDETGMNLLHFS